MATIKLDDTTADRTYVAKITRDSDGQMWNGVDDFVAENTLTDAQQATAVGLATTTPVVSGTGTHSHYIFTVPAGITVACHVGLYLTSYAVGDNEGFGAEYDPTDEAIKAKTDLIPASPAAVGSAMTVSDKTGFKLAADGLDQLSAVPVVNATTWAERMNWAIQRFFYSAKTPTELITKDAAGAPLTTQAITDDGAGTESMGPPV